MINSMIFCILLSGRPSDSWERPRTLGKTRAEVRRLGRLKRIVRENEPSMIAMESYIIRYPPGLGESWGGCQDRQSMMEEPMYFGSLDVGRYAKTREI